MFLEIADYISQLHIIFCGLEEAQKETLFIKIFGNPLIDDDFGGKLINRAISGDDEYGSKSLVYFYGDYSRAISTSSFERLLFRETEEFSEKNVRRLRESRPLYDLIDIIPIDGRPIHDNDVRKSEQNNTWSPYLLFFSIRASLDSVWALI